MDKIKAKHLVLAELNRTYEGSDELVIMDEMTIDKPYGWVFFFNTRKFVETQNMLFALGGNGPVIFEASTSEITCLGSARPPEEEIELFEQEARRCQSIE